MITSNYQNPEFRYIKICEFWKSCQLEIWVQRVRSSWWGHDSLCPFIVPYIFLCLSVCLSLYLSIYLSSSCFCILIRTSNNIWFLIVDRGFLFLSCQHPDNFIPTDHPDRQKILQMDCVIPYLRIFQTQRGYGQDWCTNHLKTHLAPLPGKDQSKSTMTTVVPHSAPLPRFDPENPRYSQIQDSTLKTHGQAMVLHQVPCKHI